MMNDREPTNAANELEVQGICLPEEAIGRLAGCRDLYVDTVVSFFGEVGKIVEQIDEAISAGNTAAMRRTAHGLKGFAGMCGAVSVAEAAAALEQCEEQSTTAERTALLARLQGEITIAATKLRSFTDHQPS
jgi:two-component system, sensor histidine kinase and response regulator